MNPSPSGEVGQHSRDTPQQVRRYLSRLSGPFLDRFDLSIEVPKLPAGALSQTEPNPITTEHARQQIHQAQQYALDRQGCLNQALSGQLNAEPFPCRSINLRRNRRKNSGSVRACRILWVARTIADLSHTPQENNLILKHWLSGDG